jgi:Tol biopolymer transport system component
VKRCIVIAALVLGALAPPAGAAFPGGNGRIAYSTGGQIHTIEPDGSDDQPLAAGFDPTWSPAGDRIAYWKATTPTDFDIWVMDADGSDNHQLTTATTHERSPAWSPDGTQLLFERIIVREDNRIQMDIMRMDDDGSNVVNLTDRPSSSEAFAAWSPDGTRIAFLSGRDELSGGGEIYVMDADGSDQVRITPDDAADRTPDWSPDGTKIVFECQAEGVGVCTISPDGTGRHRLFSTNANPQPVFSPDGTRLAFNHAPSGGSFTQVYTAPAAGGAFEPLTSSGGHAGSPDWQPLAAPIVFVHGFSGARITCGDEELFPNIGLLARPRLLDMRLADDGVSNHPDACASAAPDGLVLHAGPPGASEDIYQSTVDFLDQIAPGRHYEYVWDWRKSPEEALEGLDAMVERARCGGISTCVTPQFDKVALFAHSMGGLVVRAYIDEQEHADKVERALTVGTPYWGAPKVIFPLAAGVETPVGGPGLDLFIDNDDFKAFARNLTGAYTLFPSDNYGSWLQVAGDAGPVGAEGALDYVEDFGGNRALASAMRDLHASTLDGFETHGVDYEVVVGSGLSTIGGVEFTEQLGTDLSKVSFTNGDGTVPLKSAMQGSASDPLGEDVRIRFACNVAHVPLPGHPQVTQGFREFLLSGDDIGGFATPCSASGYVMVFGVELGSARSQRRVPVERLDELERSGAVTVIDLGAHKLVVTDDESPLDFEFSAPRWTLHATRVVDGVKGAEQVLGPFDGAARVKVGGGSVEATQPQAGAPGPADPGPGGDAPAGPGAPVPPGPGPSLVARSALLRLSLRPRRFRAARTGGSVLARRPRGAGTRVTFALSRPGSVRFGVERLVAGRRKGRRCVPKRRSGRRCSSVVRAPGGLTSAEAFTFSGRIGGRRLAPGRYRLVARAESGPARRAAFTILP